jgi:hypothetical protein
MLQNVDDAAVKAYNKVISVTVAAEKVKPHFDFKG